MGYWSNWDIRMERYDTRLLADIQVVLAFNDAYADYLRDIDHVLRQIGLAVPDVTLFRHICDAGEGVTSDWLCRSLQIDSGQLSRSLRLLEAHRLITLSRKPPDRRFVHVEVRAGHGEHVRQAVDRNVRGIAACLLTRCDRRKRSDLVSALRTLSGILRHRRNLSPENDLVPHPISRLRRAD